MPLSVCWAQWPQRLAGCCALSLTVGLLSACLGGGSDADRPESRSYAQQCSPQNPYRQDALDPTETGSLSLEKQWASAHVSERYLWYDRVKPIDADLPEYSQDNPSSFLSTVRRYFAALTRGSNPEDHFSAVTPTKAYLQSAQSGVETTTGAEWSLLKRDVPRSIRLAFVHPGSSAAQAGLQRGDELVAVDGVDVANVSDAAGLATLNGFAFGTGAPRTYAVVVKRNGVNQASVNVSTQVQALNPVPLAQVLDGGDGNPVGYLLFNSFNAISEAKLIDAVNTWRTAGIQDLVLDMRYNGGGYVYVANALASMLTSTDRTQGKLFQQLRYNDKRAADTASSKKGFARQACALDSNNRCTGNTPLPHLNLSRVFVLTSGDTCSASEAVINALEGVDVQVHRIGTTTCGKPYGFAGEDNCGLLYFPIEFQITNHKGFGDYASGFTPTCAAEDDYSHALGDPAEGQLAAALSLRRTGTCPSTARHPSHQTAATNEGPRLLRGPSKMGMDNWQPNP